MVDFTILNNLEKIIKRSKGKITKIICDVTNYSELKFSLEKIKKIDVLVNNAGTNKPELFDEWTSNWKEYTDFEIFPID